MAIQGIVPEAAVSVVRAGSATLPGVNRSRNEDRIWADAEQGAFAVVDGMGGHAAGDFAAETALSTLRERLAPGLILEPRSSLLEAVVEANNQVLTEAQKGPECGGMACVLTVVLVQNARLVCGHVGDSRLYLYLDQQLRKLTSDHSPVGEKEDNGELTEREAMRHPQRNQVFRDVGSVRRSVDDTGFVEIREAEFPPRAALLLCSDGLSDTLTSQEMAAVITGYDGDPDRTARQLVETAQQRGGTDDISAIFVVGPEFRTSDQHDPSVVVRARHAQTRIRTKPPSCLRRNAKVLLVILALVLCSACAIAWIYRSDLQAGLVKFKNSLVSASIK